MLFLNGKKESLSQNMATFSRHDKPAYVALKIEKIQKCNNKYDGNYVQRKENAAPTNTAEGFIDIILDVNNVFLFEMVI